MADCFPGEITIGGNVPASLLDEFLREVVSTGASVGDYEGRMVSLDALLGAEGLLKSLDEDGHLELADAERVSGSLRSLRISASVTASPSTGTRTRSRSTTPRTSTSVPGWSSPDRSVVRQLRS